jgi:Endo-alpha-N-acetylgalactosaminidase
VFEKKTIRTAIFQYFSLPLKQELMRQRFHFLLSIFLIHITPVSFAQNNYRDHKIISVLIYADKKTLNPISNPGETAFLKVFAIFAHGQSKVISSKYLKFISKNKLSSGTDPVVILSSPQNNEYSCRAIPKEGGIATITAVANIDGQSFGSSTDIVVRPYYHDYHQTLVLKLFMGMEGEPVDRIKNDPSYKRQPEVLCTFSQALEVIRKTDNLTAGIPKIIYLVGWQKGGHDHQYPSWDSVNAKLKRPQDSTALESLRWLIRAARQYNTIVSLHINMVDAYKSSPLWSEYVTKDVFGRDTSGRLIVRGIQVEGDSMYIVSYTREWEEGLAQKRIDKLIAMVPELEEGHTIHIDAFLDKPESLSTLSPWHELPAHGGIDIYKEAQTQWKIFRYWRARGFDVTGEGLFWAHPPGEGFYGLQPMSWWYPDDIEYQMTVPEYLSARGSTDRNGDGDFRFGNSMHGEETYKNDIDSLTGFMQEFCRTTLPWYWLSRLERIALMGDTVFYSNGVIAYQEGTHRIIRKGKFILRDNNDLFVPALWKDKSVIAYSETGYKNRIWLLPDDWKNQKSADIFRITLNGIKLLEKGRQVNYKHIRLSLCEQEAVLIRPGSK